MTIKTFKTLAILLLTAGCATAQNLPARRDERPYMIKYQKSVADKQPAIKDNINPGMDTGFSCKGTAWIFFIRYCLYYTSKNNLHAMPI